MIAERTRTGLHAAKVRGVKLGGPKLKKARREAVRALRAHAERHAAHVWPIIKQVQGAGATTLREIAAALNARGIATARGGQWHATSVRNVMKRTSG